MARSVSRRTFLMASMGIVTSISGCGGANRNPTVDEGMRINVESDKKLFPYEYTKQGQNVSPPLEVNNVPESARSIAITMRDVTGETDTPLWLIWGIDPSISGIGEGVPNSPVLDSLGGAHQGTNARGIVGYSGPNINRSYDNKDDEASSQGVEIQGIALEESLECEPKSTFDEFFNSYGSTDSVVTATYLEVENNEY